MYKKFFHNIVIGLMLAIASLSACAPREVTSIPVATNSPTPAQFPSPTAIEIVPTETENIDSVSIQASVEIDGQLSQTEVAKRLFTIWLDQALKPDMDIDSRLYKYEINNISIPDKWQACSSILGVDFIAEGDISAWPTAGQKSAWFAGGVNNINDNGARRLFDAAISKNGNVYTMQVLGVPPCFLP